MATAEVVVAASRTIFILAVILNSVFIYIVCKETRRSIGTYEYLMIFFSICNILYSSAEYVSQPAVHIYGTSYIAYSNGFLAHVKPWGFLFLCYFIAMYGMETAVLALHFIYRYFIVCRPHKRLYFENPRLTLWAIPVLLWGLFYGLITFFCFCATEEYYNYAALSVSERLNLNIRDLSFFCVFTHRTENDVTTVYWTNTFGLFLIVIMMIFTFTLMIICGIRTTQQLQKTVMSEKTRALQKQLLLALITQAIIPFLLAYMPRFVMFFSVIMGYPPLKVYSFVPLVITLYTVLDPIAIIIFIKDYRRAVGKMIRKPYEVLKTVQMRPVQTILLADCNKISFGS